MKLLVMSLLALLLVPMALAVSVDPGQTLNLPQIESNVSPDSSGTYRTYLFCSWRIDGEGEEVVDMNNSIKCPLNPETFTFNDDQTYYMRIDKAELGWSSIDEEWLVVTTGLVKEQTIEYTLSYTEPPSNIIQQAKSTILTAVRNVLCQIFPFLTFC